MAYAVVSIGGKQYRVREGQRLLVDRLAREEGNTFNPPILLVGGDGSTDLAPDGVTVTARVVAHVRGDKIRIGKYKPKKGYKRHTGFRAALSQIEIESIGGDSAPAPAEAATTEPAPVTTDAEPQERGTEPQERGGALPDGYADMTVAQVSAAAREWSGSTLQAALEYERTHSARRGAVAALESALAANDEEEET